MVFYAYVVSIRIRTNVQKTEDEERVSKGVMIAVAIVPLGSESDCLVGKYEEPMPSEENLS